MNWHCWHNRETQVLLLPYFKIRRDFSNKLDKAQTGISVVLYMKTIHILAKAEKCLQWQKSIFIRNKFNIVFVLLFFFFRFPLSLDLKQEANPVAAQVVMTGISVSSVFCGYKTSQRQEDVGLLSLSSAVMGKLTSSMNSLPQLF